MISIDEIKLRFIEVDKVFSILYPGEMISLYTAGGIGCIMNNASIRPTMDFDFVDLNYSAKYSRALNVLGDYDFIDIEFSAIDPDFMTRTKVFYSGESITVYYLSPEDLIAMKLNRYSEIDKGDIEKLISISDPKLLEKVMINAHTSLSYEPAKVLYKKRMDNLMNEYKEVFRNV